jgi:large conductance mechanosensitive channel
MFLVVKGMNKMQTLMGKEDDAPKPTPEPPPTEKLLAEIRDLLKAKDGPPPV